MDGVVQMSEMMKQRANIDWISAHQQINTFINEVLVAMLDVYEKR